MRGSCRNLVGLVETYLDGELEPSQVLEVEAHTRCCSKCAERVLLDRAIRHAVRRQVLLNKPSDDLRKRMTAMVVAEQARRTTAAPRLTRTRTLGGWWAVATTVTAAAAAALLWVRSRGPEHAASVMPTFEPDAAHVDTDNTIGQLVGWHARPLPPEITDQRDLTAFEPYVGVPVRAPRLAPFEAHWLGGRILPVVDQRVTAMLQYTIKSGHRVTLYVYDPRSIRVQSSSLRPRVVGSSPIYVGQVRGYSFAAAERRGIGYAVASDLDDNESADLALAAAPSP